MPICFQARLLGFIIILLIIAAVASMAVPLRLPQLGFGLQTERPWGLHVMSGIGVISLMMR